jgi:hypothetical protein
MTYNLATLTDAPSQDGRRNDGDPKPSVNWFIVGMNLYESRSRRVRSAGQNRSPIAEESGLQIDSCVTPHNNDVITSMNDVMVEGCLLRCTVLIIRLQDKH